jgi:Icc-related predicted phosphoesterase
MSGQNDPNQVGGPNPTEAQGGPTAPTPEPQAGAPPALGPQDGGRPVRIAAVADLHFDGSARGALAHVFAEANRKCQVLVLAGDLTTHGRPDQMRLLIEELSGVEIPIVAVLGNHDHDADAVDELGAILSERGVHLLEQGPIEIQGVGFAGIKGFLGGFGRGALAPFGEKEIKDFVRTTLDDVLSLEKSLRFLTTPIKVAVLHYAPIPDTVVGEPESILPFLGSSRLVDPIDTYGADVVFHGHAHHGKLQAKTPGGIPVYNVAAPVLRQNGLEYLLWEGRAPDRRRRAE